MKILVCGGRNFGNIPQTIFCDTQDKILYRKEKIKEYKFVHNEITRFIESFGNEFKTEPDSYDNYIYKDIIIISGCASGVDSAAIDYAICNWLQFIEYPADWKTYGKSAGPKRNQKMIDLNPDIRYILAFPGGKGTEDMVKRANKANIPVIRYKYLDGGLYD